MAGPACDRWTSVGGVRESRSKSQLRLRVGDRPNGIILWIVFVVRTVVGDSLNNDFRIVAAGEGALRVGPIVLGLAFVVAGYRPWALLVVA